MHTGVISDLDLVEDGKFSSYLSVPFSVDRSPYFQVRTPIFRVKNGEGPRLLLMAGNHGDEYEGVFALAHLIRRLAPSELKGAVTILPLANGPAVMAGRRRSPLDDGNLNRAFPGNPAGTPTERLAHYLEHELFPAHDVIFDMHSGGTSMEHLPTALIEEQVTTERTRRALHLVSSLGQKYAFVARNGYDSPTSMGAAGRAGAIGISGEFGGGGTVTPDTMAGMARAIDCLMQNLGMIYKPVLSTHVSETATPTFLSLHSHDQGIYSTRRGWFEPYIRLGQAVAAGDAAGLLHDLEALEEKPVTLRFKLPGIVISRRLHAHCEAGDCLVQAASELTDVNQLLVSQPD
ncbi:MAG: succinylglutamate desuccinylase/aspartoacylase family protein [Nitratireductor sp.]